MDSIGVITHAKRSVRFRLSSLQIKFSCQRRIVKSDVVFYRTPRDKKSVDYINDLKSNLCTINNFTENGTDDIFNSAVCARTGDKLEHLV